MNNKKRNDRSFNSKGWEPLVRIPLLVLGIATVDLEIKTSNENLINVLKKLDE